MSLRNNCAVVLDLITVASIYVMFISWEWFMEAFNLLIIANETLIAFMLDFEWAIREMTGIY